MENFREFGIYGDYDFYDHDKLEKLQESRSYKWIKLYKKIMDAREKGDEKALEKAKDAIRKHEQQDAALKEKARQHGFYWA